MKSRKIIAMLLVLSAVLSLCIAPVFAADDDEKTLKVKKTLTWDPSDDPNHATITISSNVPDISETKVLFLGTLCKFHQMDEDTVKNSLNAIAVNAEVDYYLFNADSEGVPKEASTGHIDKDGTFTGSVTFPTKKANHAALIGFASTINAKISDIDSYDYIVLEFDGSRIGNEDLSGSTASNTLNNCANKLKEYYAKNKVIWITDGAGNTDSREYGQHAYAPSNIYYYGSSDAEKKVLTATNFRNLCALVAPEYYLAHTDANSDFYGDGIKELTLDQYCLTPGEKVKDNVTGALYPDYADQDGNGDYYVYKETSRQMYYYNAEDLAKFLFMAIKGATLSFSDKIKASDSDSLHVTNINLFVSCSTATTIDGVAAGDWKLFDSFTDVNDAEPVLTNSKNISYVENASKEITVTVKNTDPQDNNLVTVNATDLKPAIKWAKLVINLEDVNGFRCCMSPKLDEDGKQVYNDKNYPMYEMNPNDGPVTVNAYSGGNMAEGSADSKHEWGDGVAAGVDVIPHKVNSSVIKGQNTYSDTVQSVAKTEAAIEKVTFDGDKVVLTYMPVPGGILKTLKIDGKTVSLTSGSYSSDTEGYEVEVSTDSDTGLITVTIPKLTQDRSVEAEFKTAVDISKVVATPADGNVKGGDDITYTIAVKNDGAVDVTNVTASDTLDLSNVSYKSSTAPEGVTTAYDPATGKITWTIAEIKAGGSVSIPLVVTVKPDLTVDETGKKVITNVASITGISGNPITEIPSAPAPVVAAPRNITVKYVFTGDNKDIATPPADSTVAYGDRLTPNTASPVPGYIFKGWFTDEACTTDFDTDTSFVNGNLGIADDVGTVKLYGKWEYCVSLDKEITTARSADAPLRGGDEVEYKITVTNTSGTDISVTGTDAGITVSDKLDSLLTYVAGSASDGGVYDSDNATITWTGIEVKANSTKSLTFKAKISGSITTETEIPNQAKGEHGSEKFESASNEKNKFKAQPKLLTVTYQYVGDAPSGATSTDTLKNSSVTYGSAYNAADEPSLDGYVFHGWYADEGCTTAYADGTTLTADRTLYGKWTSVKNFDISKSVSYNGQPITDTVAPGSTVTYSITVTNNNTAAAISDVVITDTLPEGLDNPVADNGGSISGSTVTWTVDIAKGGSKTLNINATVPGNLTVSKTFDNLATIVSAEGEPVNKNSNTATFTEKPANVTVAVTKSWSDTWDSHASDEVKVRMYANGSPSGDLITLTKDNPSWSGIVAPYDASGSAITYTFREVTVSDVETAFDGGAMNGRYKVSYGSTPTGGALIENNYVIDATDLTFNKTADGTAAPGGSFRYILTVTNKRTYEKATDIVVTDTLPEGLTLAENGLAAAAADTATANGQTIIWTIPELAGGATATLEITVNVPADVTATEYENIASITKVGDTEYGEKEVPSEKALTEVRTFKVTKSWSDASASHGAITVKLLRNGEEYETTTLNAENGWSYTFTNLPLYDTERAKYVYTASEISVEGYTTAINYSGSDDGNTSASVTNTLKTYSISYVAKGSDQPEGVKMPSDKTLSHGSPYNSEELPSAEYYDFSGWYTDPECTKPYIDGTPITGDLTLYGKWERKTADIKFEPAPGPGPEDVTYPDEEEINQGETPDTPPAPKYSGDKFKFKGWFTDPECTKPYEPGTVKGNLKLYALWEPRPEVSYSFVGTAPEGTAVPGSERVDKGDNYTSSSPTGTPQTHCFGGWYTDPECTLKYTEGTAINEDTVLYGKWNENPKISYSYKGTIPTGLTAPEAVISGYGKEFNAASKPSYTGYTFEGWYTDENCTKKFVDGTVLTESMTLYGKWSKNAGISTGDHFNGVLWTVIILSAAAGICVAVVCVAGMLRRRKRF